VELKSLFYIVYFCLFYSWLESLYCCIFIANASFKWKVSFWLGVRFFSCPWRGKITSTFSFCWRGRLTLVCCCFSTLCHLVNIDLNVYVAIFALMVCCVFQTYCIFLIWPSPFSKSSLLSKHSSRDNNYASDER